MKQPKHDIGHQVYSKSQLRNGVIDAILITRDNVLYDIVSKDATFTCRVPEDDLSPRRFKLIMGKEALDRINAARKWAEETGLYPNGVVHDAIAEWEANKEGFTLYQNRSLK